MNTNEALATEVKWRGSTYRLMEVTEDGNVKWFNPVSRHTDKCSVDAWKAADPYDKLSK